MPDILGILVHTIQLLTIMICIWYWRNKKSIQPYRLFSIGWIIVLLQDLTMVVITFFSLADNSWVFNIALPPQQLFCMFFFSRLLDERKWTIAMLLFALFAIFNYLSWQGPVKLNTMSLAVGGILIVVMAFIVLYRLYKTDNVQNFFNEPAFWISAGFIVYWGFGSPYFALFNFLWDNHPKFSFIYFRTVNFGFLVLLNLSIIKALQCSLPTKRSSFS